MHRNSLCILFLLFLLIGSPLTYAQRIAINNNVLFDAAGALSMGIEIPCSKKISIETYASVRPWKRAEDNVHKHWLLQTQCRIWPCQVMNGFFYGPYAHTGQFNIGNHELFFGLLNGLKPNRYEGWLIGGGMGVGYEYVLAKHWSLCAEVGVGYTYIKYKKYYCEVCGRMKEDKAYHYFGVSRLALSLIYVF